MNDKEEIDLEYEIQNKGLNSPRITPSHVDSKIREVYYFIVPDTTMTICVLTLMNGYQVTGNSSCASIENFDKEIGQEIAYKNAREKIWELEGYLLKEKMFQENRHV